MRSDTNCDLEHPAPVKTREVIRHILKKLENDLPDYLVYHSVTHTKSVLKMVDTIITGESIPKSEADLVRVAAAYHDCGFLIRYNHNEPIACDIATQELPRFDFSPTQIEKICSMIMATAIPQNPTDLLSEILCDADLGYLGTDQFYQIANKLRQELETRDLAFRDPDWATFQVLFLEKHSYFTKTAKTLWESTKQKHLAELKLKQEGLRHEDH